VLWRETDAYEEETMNPARLASLVLIVTIVLTGMTVPTEAQQAVPAAPATTGDSDAASVAGATVANIWYVPGRALVCGGGLLVSATIMTVTFGHSYDDATVVAKGVCSGPWVIRPADIRRSLK
jgi:hypothetical protein